MATPEGQVWVRQLRPENYPLVAGWLSNPLLNRYLTADWRGRSVDATVIAIAVRQKRNRMYEFGVEAGPCGLVAFSELLPADRSGMIWYVMGDPERSGRGLTTQAVRLACQLGFSELGLESIWAMVLEPNVRSHRVLRRVGFQVAGTLRRVECLEGQQVNRTYYDLLPAELVPSCPPGGGALQG